MKSSIKKIAKKCTVYPEWVTISKQDMENVLEACKDMDYYWDGECENPYILGYDIDNMIKILTKIRNEARKR